MLSLYRFLSLLAILFLTLHLSAQCGLTVNAGADERLCDTGGTVQLGGNVSGPNLLGIRWSPEEGLSDPSSISPLATVTESTTYTLIATHFNPSNNLILNGDFSLGVQNFTTEYTLGTGGPFGPLSNEGTYQVDSDPLNTHRNFASCGDHTSGAGRMLIVNGATVSNEAIWCQTVAVNPGFDYAFSAWLSSVISQNPARLQFSVNGALLGSSFRASRTVCEWLEFTEVWNAGAAASAEICIVNQNTGLAGNDFAIDDLFFGEICEQTDEVSIELVSAVADAPSTEILPCNLGSQGFELNASASSTGANFFYAWNTPDGNIVAGGNTLTPSIDRVGTYTLTVNYNDGNTSCTDSTTVIVSENPNIPQATANRLSDLSCANPTTRLTADGSTSGADIGYNWSTNNGLITGGANTNQATIAEPGTYSLLVTHLPSGCTASATTTVFADRTAPTINILPPGTLDCRADSLELDARNSVMNGSIIASWTTPDGDIASGATTLLPTVSAPGSYTLSLTNTLNGCTATRTVVVQQTVSALEVVITQPDTLSCRRSRVALVGTASNGTDYDYEWSTPNGNLLSGQDQAAATADAGGIYILKVTDEVTACIARDTVVVIIDTLAPLLALQGALPFTCGRAQMNLDATASDQGPNFSYRWTTTNGLLLSDTFGPNPLVTGPGTYSLEIENTRNGCRTSDSLMIGQDITIPSADAGLDFTLTCRNLQGTLTGRSAGASSRLIYQWTTAGGAFLSGISTLDPVIDAPGSYFLAVTDTVNACIGRDTVVIDQDIELPTANIAPPAILNCEVTTLRLNAAGTDFGAGFTLDWRTDEGSFLEGTETLRPRINAPGRYLLTVENTLNGCTQEASVTIAQDISVAAVSILPVPFLDCERTEVNLEPRVTGMGTNYSYQWRTDEGRFLGASNLAQVPVNAPGTYRLEVLNEDNRCSSFAAINVVQVAAPPELFSRPTNDLDCRDSQRQIIVTTPPAEGELSIAWTTEDGRILSGENSLRPMVDLPGTYRLAVRNQENGCRNEIAIAVGQNILPPQLEVASEFNLGCTTDPQPLTAAAAGQGAITYSWTTTNGLLLDGDSTATPLINGPGNYQLSIVDEANGCSAEASLLAFQNLLDSFAFTQVAPDCRVPTGSIRFTEVVGGTSPFVYSFDGGQNFGGNTESEALFPGRYSILVQDANGCELTQETIIPNAPELELVLGGRVVLPLGETYQLQPQTNFTTDRLAVIDWTPTASLDCADCLQPMARPTESTMYTLALVSTDGCTAKDSVEVIVDKRRDVFFPTAFSPNGDGQNDFFLPFGSVQLIEVVNEISIHDRWGNTMFQAEEIGLNDPAGGWDGRYRGQPVNPAVFVYSATVTFIDGEQMVFKGSFTLLR